jgi:hypothetical protein
MCSLRAQLDPGDEANPALGRRDSPFTLDVEPRRATYGLPRKRPFEAHVLDGHGIALQVLGFEPGSGADRSVSELLHTLRFWVPLGLTPQVDPVVEDILG